MKRALIVDDIKENLYLLESLLKGNGYATVTANNGAEALGLAMKDPPDIIIADILMPVMDGYTLCREWKKMNVLKNIPFVFYTATYTHPKDGEFALSLGADRFIIKPQEPENFMAIIEQVLNEFRIGKIQASKPAESSEVAMLKEYNETLIRKMEDRMQKSDDAEKKIRIYATQLETEIEHRKQVEKAIQQSEEKYRHIFENIQDVYYEATIEGTIIEVSPSIETLSKDKYRRVELIGRSIDDFYVTKGSRNAFLVSLLEKGSVTDFEINLKNQDGSTIPCSVSARMQTDANGKPLKIIGSIRDITERKRAEEILIENEAKYRTLVTQSPDGIFIMDLSGTFLSVNKTMCENLKYTEEEFLSMKLWDIVPPGYMPIHKNRLADIIKGERKNEAAEYEVKGKDGILHSIEVLSAPYYKDKAIIGFQGIARDVTERKRAEKELIEAKNRAEESDLLKSAFLANMSHEVRTPLNSIIGFSELLADSYFEEEQKKEFIQNIITSGNSLLNIISDIMDLSKMQSGQVKIRRKQLDVLKLISTVKEQFAIQAEENKLELLLTYSDNNEETIIFTDPERLRQIFNNLMSNAIKFTAEGRIEIGYQHKGEMIEFYVKDTGIGIPEEYHKKIFERFRQVETEKTRKYGGNGLGLAITKNLVELMGGKIWIESETGKGSSFYFTVPCNNGLEETNGI